MRIFFFVGQAGDGGATTRGSVFLQRLSLSNILPIKILVCDMTRSHVWLDVFTGVTWLIQLEACAFCDCYCEISCQPKLWCGIGLTDTWYRTHICVIWLIDMCDMTHWGIDMCDMTQWGMLHVNESCHIWVRHVTYEWVVSNRFQCSAPAAACGQWPRANQVYMYISIYVYILVYICM